MTDLINSKSTDLRDDKVKFFIKLDEKSNKPLYVQLYERIVEEIVKGNLEANAKMPSIRKLADDLSMSKTTIENTYHQLLIEGYIYSIYKKGYYIKDINHTLFNTSNKDIKVKSNTKKNQIIYDLTQNSLDIDIFDLTLWKKIITKTINEQGINLYEHCKNQGEIELRGEICKYLYKSRGVNAETDQIIIGAGIQPLLNILVRIFRENNFKKVAFEDPGFNRAKNILKHNELQLIPIKNYQEGINIKELISNEAEVCYLSPSHQFPTGTIMPVNKRLELINWANSNKPYIIEDDYNSELRYHGRPIPSLQGLDNGTRVIYLGSFSTIFLPSIRISFMVLPNPLLKNYYIIKDNYAQNASKLEQLSLATFMKEGFFEKHIRRLKVYYSKKNELVKQIIKQIFKNNAKIHSSDSGFNLYIELITNIEEQEIKDTCKQKGVAINVLSDFTVENQKRKYPVMIISYKGIKLDEFEKALFIVKNEIFNNGDNPLMK